ncbi:MAG: hypothetical protein QXR84_05795 [Candidatus Bathyarchaeia archaeon]
MSGAPNGLTPNMWRSGAQDEESFRCPRKPPMRSRGKDENP